MKRRIYLGIFVSVEAFLSWVTEEAKILQLSGQGEPVVGVQELNATKETMKWRLEMKDLNCFLTMNFASL